MAKIIKIKNAGSGKYLNIHGSNVTSLTPHQNVTIWEDSGTNEQKWQIPDTNIIIPRVVAPIRSVINTSYGLNVYRSGTPYNCDVYPVSVNETDSNIEIDMDLRIAYGKIKLKNYDLYLTAASKANGTNVYWAADSNSVLQMWRFISEDDEDDGEGNDSDSGSGNTTSKTLTMPQNLNQRYKEYEGTVDYDAIYKYGCCVCCVADVASYYAGKKYTVDDMLKAGVYVPPSASVIWTKVPSANFTFTSGLTESAFLAKIKEQIDYNRPVLVEMKGTYVRNGKTETGTHWVVAYGYTNGCANTTNCLVLDPYNSDKNSIEGKKINLNQAMAVQESQGENGNYWINSLAMTSAEN